MHKNSSKLLECPWNLVPPDEDSTEWLMKFVWDSDDNSYLFILTNSFSVFAESLNSNDIETRCKKLNKRLEAPIATILAHLQKSTQQNQITLMSSSDNERIVNISNQFYSGIPFTWNFVCKKDHTQTESLSKMLLGDPMVLSIARLLFENNKLKELLQQKDSEIKDYKDSGYKVSRPHLETKVFKMTDFNDELRCTREYSLSITQSPLKIISGKAFNDALITSVMDSKSNKILELAKSLPSNSSHNCESKSLAGLSKSPIKRKLTKRRARPAVRGCVLDANDKADEVISVDKEDNSEISTSHYNVKKQPKDSKLRRKPRKALF